MNPASVSWSYANISECLGKRDGRKLANNTYATRNDNIINIRLHWTIIASLLSNGEVALSNGGYATPTTKDRVNQVLAGTSTPWRVCQHKHAWMLYNTKIHTMGPSWDSLTKTYGAILITSGGLLRI